MSHNWRKMAKMLHNAAKKFDWEVACRHMLYAMASTHKGHTIQYIYLPILITSTIKTDARGFVFFITNANCLPNLDKIGHFAVAIAATLHRLI